MSSPVVSVIIPTFNRSNLLQQTLDSLRKQTFKDWEALVVDDGSEDDTETKVTQVSCDDARIQYLPRSGKKSGAPVCRNQGTAVSRGEYIIYLDSDDCLSPGALENRLKEMARHPSLDFGVFPCILFRDKPGDVKLLWNVDTEVNDIDRFLAFDIPWQTTSPIWRRSALLRLGPWQEYLSSWQDWEYHLRALIRNFRYGKFSKPDCFWRISPRKTITSGKKSQVDSIGSYSKLPKNLRAYERLFLEIQQMLLEAELLTNQRYNLFVELYSWLAQAWIFNGSKEEALRIWTLCYDKDWIDCKLYQKGRWYLKNVASLRGIRQFVCQYLECHHSGMWLYFPRSKTFRKSPLPASWQLDGSNVIPR